MPFLCRGNIGLDVAPEKMALVQKQLISNCNLLGKPVLITRVVDSMVTNPRPTRAEATGAAALQHSAPLLDALQLHLWELCVCVFVCFAVGVGVGASTFSPCVVYCMCMHSSCLSIKPTIMQPEFIAPQHSGPTISRTCRYCKRSAGWC